MRTGGMVVTEAFYMRAHSDRDFYSSFLYETPFPDASGACQKVLSNLDLVKRICAYLVL